MLAGLVAIDVGLAASTRRLRFSRSPDSSARLGQPVEAGLLIHNDGRRRFRGQVRDAWPPSARAEPRTHRLVIAAGQRQHVDTKLRPVRRGDQRAAVITARSIGPLGMAGRQSSQSGTGPGPGAAAIPVSQASAVAVGQAARDRRAAAHPDPRTGHRVRLAARVCRRRRRSLDRLAGKRAAHRCDGPHLAARTRPARGDRARHRAHGSGTGRCRPDGG